MVNPEGFNVNRKIIWLYRIGISLVFIGIWIIIGSFVFYRFGYGFSDYYLFLAGIGGLITLTVGVIFLIKGIHERYFIPLRHLIHRYLPPEIYSRRYFPLLPPFKLCSSCKRQIPIVSNVCPYCGKK